MLGELANELAGMAEHMKRLSDRIEDVALAVEQERESNAKSMESYRQLKALLKSLQGRASDVDIVDIANDYAERELAERLYSESSTSARACTNVKTAARRFRWLGARSSLGFGSAGTARNWLSGGLCDGC